MNNISKHILVITTIIILLFIVILNSNAFEKKQALFSKHFQIIIIGFRNYGNDDWACKNWRLNENQVKYFFNNSKIVSSVELNMEYDWYTCYMHGIIYDQGKKFEWKIFLEGIGIVKTPEDKLIWFGCKDKCGKLWITK